MSAGTQAGRMWGVTVDNVSDVAGVVDALKGMKRRPTVRIVFDPGTSPAYYAGPLDAIHRVADVMGEPIDSAPPSGKMTVDEYRRRMSQFMDGLGSRVDVWEIGNEVNGDWTGDSALMGAKVGAAFGEASNRHVRSALTLFYSDFYLGGDRDLRAWSRKYLYEPVRRGVNYVLISFYPDSATGPHPDWKRIFGELAEIFPHAQLGFGELGLRKADFSLSTDSAAKQALIRRYYRMPSPLDGALADRYIGGYFWWTFRQDAVGRDSPLWKTFRDVVR